MTVDLIPGAEPWTHVADGASAGVLVLHGFTGNPSSMRGMAEAFAAAGLHVEMPRLPGHGTTIDDMLTTTWPDWLGEAEAAYARLAERASVIVVAGLSMGGAITLHIGSLHPDVAGLVCVNPAAQPLPAELMTMLLGMLDDGTTVMPGIGSDIADPGVVESAYDGAPLPQLLSLTNDGLAPLAELLPEMTVPLLLINSRNDHVVDPGQAEFLAATYGGPVERVTLERSFHVATQDLEKDIVFARSVEFALRVTTAP
ncbi:MAG: alpha/beta fold hydrolase [Ilumatobacteraceae bacterium]